MSETDPKFMPIRTQQEETVLRCARKYARMKLFGKAVENNLVVTYCRTDQEMIGEHFRKELERAAVDLINAMATDEVNGRLRE